MEIGFKPYIFVIQNFHNTFHFVLQNGFFKNQTDQRKENARAVNNNIRLAIRKTRYVKAQKFQFSRMKKNKRFKNNVFYSMIYDGFSVLNQNCIRFFK